MFNIPNDIVYFFFDEINKKGKYNVFIDGSNAYIRPRIEEEYYKPIIKIKDINEFKIVLLKYIKILTQFYSKYNVKKEYHGLSYFFNNLLFNMTYSDAEDLTKYIYKRISFFQNEEFAEYVNRTLICEVGDVSFYAKRVTEECGLETPFILIFEMEIGGITYPLPLIRYAFDNNNVCHLFTIQFGKNRDFDCTIQEYKNIVNKVNNGVKKYRNVSPSFVLSFTLFIKMLQEKEIQNIIVPSFLFSRYRHYFGAKSLEKSDLMLNRILDNFVTLLQRMEYEINDFNITSYLEEIDSYTHIKLGNLTSKNNLVRSIISNNNQYK